MAHVSLSVSTQAESVMEVEYSSECLSITLSTNIESCGGPYPYSRDWVTIHGTHGDLIAFANLITAAMQPEESELKAVTA